MSGSKKNYSPKNLNKHFNSIDKNNTVLHDYPNTIKNSKGITHRQHDVEDKYRATLFSEFLQFIDIKYDLHGMNRGLRPIASGGGGFVYRVVISDTSGTVVGMDTSLKENKKRFYDFMTKTTKRNVPRSEARMLPNEFILKLQVTTTQKNKNIIKSVEKSQVKEDFINHFLSRSPLSSKYVPMFYMGGSYTWGKYRIRMSCMELIKGYQLESLLRSDMPLPKQIISNLDKACMSLWSQGFVHRDLHGGNILVYQDLRIIIIDYGNCERYDDKTNSSNISNMRRMIRRIENHR